jgi:hypothetical protein
MRHTASDKLAADSVKQRRVMKSPIELENQIDDLANTNHQSTILQIRT